MKLQKFIPGHVHYNEQNGDEQIRNDVLTMN